MICMSSLALQMLMATRCTRECELVKDFKGNSGGERRGLEYGRGSVGRP